MLFCVVTNDYILFKSLPKSCRSGAVFISHIQTAFIWTWNGLKAEDSVNKADRERDEKRIWHLQSQVLRELPGSEVQTQAARHTLKFQSPRSRECPVSLLLAPPSISSSSLCLGPRIGRPESLLGCTANPVTLASDFLCPLSFHSECPLHGTQRLWLSPVSASDPEAEFASGLGPRPATLHSEYTVPGQEGEPDSPFVPSMCAAGLEVDGWGLVGPLPLCPQKESKQVQQSRLQNPDVTGLSKTWRGSSACQLAFYFSAAQPANQPTHCRLQSTGPKAQGATTRGWFTCVFVPEFLRGQVCVYVCVLVEAGPWELRVGASWLQQWLLPWQPRRERCVEWVSGRGIYSRCMCAGDVALFMNLVI